MAMRFQQLTGPVMAKAVEDTAFYRYMPLLALNEVGGDPASAGAPPEEFHEWCRRVQQEHPYTLLATSTHDTKRSEDVRARLSVLSEMAGEWDETAERWRVLNRRRRVADLPDGATEWMLYQTLVGAWPIEPPRVLALLEKAVREAKVHTSWDQVNEIYEGAVRHFTEALLRSRNFLAEMEAFVARVAGPGRSNSLALKLLTLTAAGVPDIYQGTELWDYSLVDPDNRRPVDYRARAALLEQAGGRDLVQAWREGDRQGLTKLAVVQRALDVRRRHPAAFGEGRAGAYEALAADGPAADHCLAFGRGTRVVTVVTRLPVGLGRAGGWRGTTLSLPRGHWRDVLSGTDWSGRVALDGLLAGLPVALLERVRAG